MDFAAVTPLKQLYPTTAYQAAEGQNNRLSTDLSPGMVVSPAVQSDAVLADKQAAAVAALSGEGGSDGAEQEATAEPRFEADDRTNRLVYKVVDTSSGVVVQQLPTENSLKLRAYAEQLSSEQASAEADTESVERTA